MKQPTTLCNWWLLEMHRPSMKQPTTVYLTNLMLVIPKFKELDRDKCETYALFITVKVSNKTRAGHWERVEQFSAIKNISHDPEIELLKLNEFNRCFCVLNQKLRFSSCSFGLHMISVQYFTGAYVVKYMIMYVHMYIIITNQRSTLIVYAHMWGIKIWLLQSVGVVQYIQIIHARLKL